MGQRKKGAGVVECHILFVVLAAALGNFCTGMAVNVRVLLSDNLIERNRAYTGQRVTFRCVIVGVDTVVTWRSQDYIGTGGDVLQLASADPVGQTASNSRNPTTVATLISTSRNGGVTTTISELQLTASSQFPNSSVSCEVNSHGPVNSTSFRVEDPDVTLTHDLIEGNRAYTGQRVTFRCVIVGLDTVVTWRSQDYIGTGGDVLQLASADPVGFTASNARNPTTVATLINTTRNGGETTTISQLQLTASSEFSSSSVSCEVNGQGPVNTTLFQVVDPDVVLTSNLFNGNRAYDGQQVTFRCIIVGIPSVLTWRSSQYIGTGGDVLQLASADPAGQTASNSRNPFTVATLISSSQNGGVTTTVSELQLTASSQFPSSNVSCGINSHGPVVTSLFQTVLGVITTTMILNVTTNRFTDDKIDPTFDTEDIKRDVSPLVSGVAGAVAVVILFLLIAGLIFMLLTYMHRVKGRKRPIQVHAVKVKVNSTDAERGDISSEIAVSETTASDLSSTSSEPTEVDPLNIGIASSM